jgi:hypothetical protein
MGREPEKRKSDLFHSFRDDFSQTLNDIPSKLEQLDSEEFLEQKKNINAAARQ